MVGAHLDSVREGPGINDNGSGSAAILEVAEQMRKVKPVNTVRFAWWGAEESGLVGSTFYVNNLTQAERDAHRPVPELRHDRLAELRPVRLRRWRRHRAGRASRARRPSRPSSTTSTPLGARLRARRRSTGGPTTGRSSLDSGIPAGGLFTGAEGIKTPAQVAVYGGTAGQQYDPCYHQACDTFANNSNLLKKKPENNKPVGGGGIPPI